VTTIATVPWPGGLLNRLMASVLLPALLLACASQEREAQPLAVHTEIDTIGGVEHVRNSGIPSTWRLETKLTLGSVGSVGEPAPDEFGRVASAILGSDDRLYVADQMNSEVKVFDSDGSLVLEFGRSGKGPGEFGGLYSLAWVSDTLLALDFGAGRVAMFDRHGGWLGQRRHSGSITGSPALLRLYQTADDEAYAWSLHPTPTGIRSMFVRHTPAAAEDTLWQLSWNPKTNSYVQCDSPNGAIHFWDIPFYPTFLQHPAQGLLIAAVTTDAYAVAYLRNGGDTVRVVERVGAPVPTTAAEWDEGLKEYREFRDENPGVPCEPKRLQRPEYKPPVHDMLLDSVGRLWVETETLDGAFWEVFDRGGILVGRVPVFPRGERTAPYITEDHIVAVATDSLGVESVTVYELHP
jgi:hypothetical protein